MTWLVEQHEGVVVAAVAREEAARVAETLQLLGDGMRAPKSRLVGDHEAEQVDVEVARRVDVDDVEAEVAQAADLERAVEQHSADVVSRLRCKCHHAN